MLFLLGILSILSIFDLEKWYIILSFDLLYLFSNLATNVLPRHISIAIKTNDGMEKDENVVNVLLYVVYVLLYIFICKCLTWLTLKGPADIEYGASFISWAWHYLVKNDGSLFVSIVSLISFASMSLSKSLQVLFVYLLFMLLVGQIFILFLLTVGKIGSIREKLMRVIHHEDVQKVVSICFFNAMRLLMSHASMYIHVFQCVILFCIAKRTELGKRLPYPVFIYGALIYLVLSFILVLRGSAKGMGECIIMKQQLNVFQTCFDLTRYTPCIGQDSPLFSDYVPFAYLSNSTSIGSKCEDVTPTEYGQLTNIVKIYKPASEILLKYAVDRVASITSYMFGEDLADIFRFLVGNKIGNRILCSFANATAYLWSNK